MSLAGRIAWLPRSIAARPVLLSAAIAMAGAVVWVTVFPRVGTDLSAAYARAQWASAHPGAAYILSWYGGIYPASYSLIAPFVLAVVGTRLAMALAAIAAAALITEIAVQHRVPRPRAVAIWSALGMLTQLTAGRAAFTLGLAAAAGCLVIASLRASRPDGVPPTGPGWARGLALAGLGLLTSALSPVAGLFLGIVAVALLLAGYRARGLLIGLAAAVPLGVMALFPGTGPQPVGVQNWLPPLAAVTGVLILVGRRWRVVRIGAVVYGLAVLAVVILPTPVGSNIERLGELLAALLVAGLGTIRARWAVVAGVAAAGVWLAAQPAQDLMTGNAPPFAPQTAALVRELGRLHADTARVEAVPQYGHWESQALAGVVWLARGWERQADMARDPLFYRGTLTPSRYYAWLRDNAVRYVALPSGPLDWSAGAEASLVRAGQPWLVPVWRDSLWKLYLVAGTLPLASAPARVLATTPAALTLRMPRGGSTLVRVHWSRWLRVTRVGPGSAGGGDPAAVQRGSWTVITVRSAGTYRLSAEY
jgi:hypothetical protein